MKDVETCIFLMCIFLIWAVRSVENKTEKGQKERDKRKMVGAQLSVKHHPGYLLCERSYCCLFKRIKRGLRGRKSEGVGVILETETKS